MIRATKNGRPAIRVALRSIDPEGRPLISPMLLDSKGVCDLLNGYIALLVPEGTVPTAAWTPR